MASQKADGEDWVKCSSNSHPGRHYLFNTSTGEKKWISNEVTAKNEATPKLPRIKTPAQDRLKRLQSNLKINQLKSPVNPNRFARKSLQIELNSKESSTSEISRRNSSSFIIPTVSKSIGKDDEEIVISAPVRREKRKSLIEEDIPKKMSRNADAIAETPETSTSNQMKVPKNLNKKSWSNITANFANKIKEFYKRQVAPIMGKTAESENSVGKTFSKDTKETVNALKDLNAIKSAKSLGELRSPTDVVGYKKGTANKRLKCLRDTLQRRASSETELDVLSSTGSPLNNRTESTDFPTNVIISTNDEPMDWDPVDTAEPKETSVTRRNARFLSKQGSQNIANSKYESIGDIYDAVNENLLRISAEKNNDGINNNSRWLHQYYYFILDTNVLLQHLSFIEDLSNFKLCDTEGTILFIPYCVLQELDRLKQRSGSQEGVKTLAIRAIKYLNGKFESKSPHLQAQSAIDERRHLIDVSSPDDSIINACLQVKKHIKNVLFLTEDINLRNKSICNNILVSTKSDLLTKHYDITPTNNKS
uniref:PINc domain-containing protein n=1 Tax=Glossina austeni TaxID=7395 RepID=A0A1A9VWV9_GLOAU